MDSGKKGSITEVLKNTEIELLALLTEPDAVQVSVLLEAFVKEHAEISNEDIELWITLLKSLNELSLEVPPESFFSRQEKEILETLRQEPKLTKEDSFLFELKELATEEKKNEVLSFDEGFFSEQRKKIEQNILEEITLSIVSAESSEKNKELDDSNSWDLFEDDFEGEWAEFKETAEQLKSLDEQDPGELFFRRQEKEILQKLVLAKKKFSLPIRAFAAAAMLLLVIGAGKILHDQSQFKFSQVDDPSVNQAELSPKLEFVDIDDLDTQQLDRLANRLSQKVWQGVREEWVEPSSDWEDLNSEEMKNLIEKLEDSLKT